MTSLLRSFVYGVMFGTLLKLIESFTERNDAEREYFYALADSINEVQRTSSRTE